MKVSEKLPQPERIKKIRSLLEEKRTGEFPGLSEAREVSENSIGRKLPVPAEILADRKHITDDDAQQKL